MIKYIIEKIIYLIKQNKISVLATILRTSGSTPRIQGTSMVISQDGHSFGTIGGGFLEAKIIKYASKIIVKKRASVLDIHLSTEEAGGIGMICGGNLSVMLTPIFAEKTTKVFFNSCLDIIKKERKCSLLIIYDEHQQSFSQISYYLIYGINSLLGNKKPSKKEFFLIQQYCSKDYDFNVSTLNGKMAVKIPIYTSKLYIIGAGHVAQPTASMAKMVGFDVVIMDDRESFANYDRFPDVESIKIVDFNNVFSNINVECNAFIVIITRGHAYDSIVLEQSISTNAAYVGMIGSKSKINLIFCNLRQKGIKEEDIKKIYSPIGIDIHSETPEEIALSIVAEMVLVRARGRGSKNRNREYLSNLV